MGCGCSGWKYSVRLEPRTRSCEPTYFIISRQSFIILAIISEWGSNLITGASSFLAWGEPRYATVIIEGDHLSNSMTQLLRVDRGTTIRNGPEGGASSTSDQKQLTDFLSKQGRRKLPRRIACEKNRCP